MKILYIDSFVVVCSKPAGVLSEGEGSDCLPYMLRQELRERGENNTEVYAVHRLDRETVGVIVYARTPDSAAFLSAEISSGNFCKQYLAVLCGVPSEKQGTLCDLLFYDRSRSKSFVVGRARKGVKKAILDYTLIQTVQERSLVLVTLGTGRTHQIRVQFSSRGLPLTGDRRYGAPKDEVNSVALCARKLSFTHPETKERMTFYAEIPNELPWSLFSSNYLTMPF